MEFSPAVLFVMAMLSVVMETEGCMCEFLSLREFYCQADFAVKAIPSNWTTDNDLEAAKSTFTLNILHSYKMPRFLANETEITVSSWESDGLCGINPGRPSYGQQHRQTHRPIFITGEVREDGTLWTQLCSHIAHSWRWIPKPQRRMIRKFPNLTC
ncbi:uncharacterized protein [Haliotis cracherodii]|uniref:uncharacterized protein n=1 Tax=Haliotis cracherodii TaxID=6455 RepID=UPI0039E7360E